MKITDLQLDGFGVWKGLTVESLSDDLTVFCGYNEAGKTTMMQFIRAMMFGFSPERLDKYTPPVYGGLAGGSLDIDTRAGIFEVQRHVDPNRHSDPIGDLAVTDSHDGSVHGRAHLSDLMSDIDESIFVNVFAIGLREIQELNALNSTAAADQLYKLTSGMDRVSLIDVMRDLQRRRELIWLHGSKVDSRLEELAQKRNERLREIDELKQRSKRWSQVAAETTDLNHQLEDIERDLEQKERELRLIDIAVQIHERWNQRKSIQDQIELMGKLPDRRDVAIEKLDDFNQKISRQKDRVEQIRLQRKTIKSEAMALPINRMLWKQKARIEAVTEHMPWVESLQRQTTRLTLDIERIENQLDGEVEGLGHQVELEAADIKDLPKRGIDGLESASRKLQAESDRLAKFEGELEKVEFDLGQHQERLGTSLAERSTTESLEDTGRYVNRLRRRIELGEKIDKLNRSRQTLERDVDSVVSEQVLPVEKLAIIGIIFVAGVLMIGVGLFWDNDPTVKGLANSFRDAGLISIFLGISAGLFSLGLKYHWDRTAREDLDDFRHQIDIVRQQLKRAKQERDEIESKLPNNSSGNWELELKDAENRLNRLEDLVPLEDRVHSTRSVQEDIRRRIAAQEREVKAAEEQWQSSLRTAGLPETLRPNQLREITQRSERVATLFHQLDQFNNERTAREKELTALNQRIDLMLSETGLEFESENLIERLNQLHRAINEQRQFVNARKELAEKYKLLRTRYSKAQRELEKLLGQKQRLLAVVGVESEQEYRDLDAQHHRRRKLVKSRDGISEQIEAALGKHHTEDQLAQLLDNYGAAGLEKHWEFVQSEIDRVKDVQSRLLQQRGEFVQEVKMLGEDARLDIVQLELNAIEAEMEQLKEQWQVLAASTQMLELIRETYESKRQPETLKEASAYLDRLTEGAYPRIWTRLIGEELLVDNDDGDTLPVHKLSRGTREAVYLSLRLALVGAYARRGAVIPMILDDVLVNFDGRRATAAADLLHDFARNGHQILMFTCHDHIRDIFHSLGADVRILPEHLEVVESGAVPAVYRGDVIPMAAPEPVAETETAPPETVEEPAPRIPVEYISSNVHLEPDDYDAELEYELSALASDQRSEQRLRSELVYISPNLPAPVDLSGDEEVWSEASRMTY